MIDNLPKIKDWIFKYCDKPEPVKLRLSEADEVLIKMDRKFGEEFYDTYLLAKEKDYTVLSDDFAFSKFLKSEKNMDSVWITSLLEFLKLKSDDEFEKQKFDKGIEKLVSLNYNPALHN